MILTSGINGLETYCEITNIMYVTDIRGDLTLLNDQLKIAIYRITQESINNAAKY
ncbi:MAG: hypothetical protein GY781_13395 [Gammaproteobacteria bacterium]|nr:hypothetical protein [Gammaproteobacteria bacterium]